MKYILLLLFLLTACADDSVKVYQYKKEVLDRAIGTRYIVLLCRPISFAIWETESPVFL
jgi:hypothetical protein